MPPPIPLPLGLQSSPGMYGHDAGGRLINAYADRADEKGKAQFPIRVREGLASFATLTGGGAFRGAVSLAPNGYVVAGTVVFKVNSGGGITNIGSFPGAEPVFMAANRSDEIILVSDGLRYSIIADVVATIADTDLPSGVSVTFLDGYFVVGIADGRFFWNTLDDVTAWASADFATAEAIPDGLMVVHARGSELLLFGPSSIEFWASTGAPFERIPGTLLKNFGLLCRHSVRDINDVPFFVASDGTVRMLNGYQPVRISTADQERDIGGIADKDTIVATAYSLEGHQYYCLSSPTWTWVYDATIGLWHERISYGETRWRAEGFVNIDGVPAVGDFESALLYELDPDANDDAGEHLIWTLRTPPVHAYPNPLGFNALYLDTIPGTGLNSATAALSDPQVMLDWSDNGGKTFSDERQASVGAIGEFNKRVVFRRLGQTKEDGRIFRISMSAAVVRGLLGGAIDAELLEP